jgi:hypothetical protein
VLLSIRSGGEATREEPFPDARLVEARFVCSTERVTLDLSLAEVLVHLSSTPQVIRDDGIDVGELQGRISLSDLLGRGAVPTTVSRVTRVPATRTTPLASVCRGGTSARRGSDIEVEV